MMVRRVQGQPLPAAGEDVLADPRWEALASGEATPEEVASLRAWAERSTAARAAWEMFQPVDEVRSDELAAGVLRVLRARDPKASDVHGEDALFAGRYRLLKEIGRGSQASIWEAEDTHSGRIVVVKRPPTSPWEPRAGEEHPLRREARVLLRVAHPNIVELLDVGTTAEGEPFLVMPRLRGQSLSELLKSKGRIEPALAVRIAREVASALAVVHEARLIHRAIHPSNVFLQEGAAGNLVAMLVNFDVCNDLGQSPSADARTAGVAMGFPMHLSPEQVSARHDIDGRSDIWSLGIVLYEMLTGTRPFRGPVQDVIRSILTDRVPPPSLTCCDLPPLFDELVQRCTATKREERIQTAAEVHARLDTIEAELSAEPSVPAPSTSTTPYRAPARATIGIVARKPSLPAPPVVGAAPAVGEAVPAASSTPARRRKVAWALPLAMGASTIGAAALGWMASSSTSIAATSIEYGGIVVGVILTFVAALAGYFYGQSHHLGLASSAQQRELESARSTIASLQAKVASLEAKDTERGPKRMRELERKG